MKPDPAEQQLEDSLKRFANVDLSDLAKRSIWDGKKKRDVWSFYCPLCACTRRVGGRPQPGGFKHIAQILITTAVFMIVTWPWFAWKGVVVVLPLWAFFEVFYRLRIRAALSCPNCGFDPFLYLRDRRRARQEVERHWRKIFEEKGIPYPENPGKISQPRSVTESRPAEKISDETGPK